MKITDRMCNVEWCKNQNAQGKYIVPGVLKEHAQPTVDSDYNSQGYYTLSTKTVDFYRILGRGSSDPDKVTIAQDFTAGIGLILFVFQHGSKNEGRYFAVKAVTMARNYRTHEIDHVVLTLIDANAVESNGGS